MFPIRLSNNIYRLLLFSQICMTAVFGEYNFTLLLTRFSNGQGYLADATHCNSFWYQPNQQCNMAMRICVEMLDETYDNNTSICNNPTDGFIDMGNVTINSNSIDFESNLYKYGDWINPYSISRPDSGRNYLGFQLKLQVNNSDAMNGVKLIDEYVHIFDRGRIGAGSAHYSHQRENVAEPTLLQLAWIVSGNLAPTTPPTNGIPQDCLDLHNSGSSSDGPYVIQPQNSNQNITVWCDMTNGGYTVIQSRSNSNGLDDSFSIANYTQYQAVFGDITTTITNHWLGLDNMYTLLTNRKYSLVVDLCCNNQALPSVIYNSFSIGDNSTFYRLNVSNGTGGCDGLNYKSRPEEYADNGSQFYATGVIYNNPDPPQSLCDSLNRNNNGGWWFGSCIQNPNGYLYNTSQFTDPANCVPNANAGHGIGVTWCGITAGVTKMRMKIIPQSNLRSMEAIQNEAVGYCAA